MSEFRDELIASLAAPRTKLSTSAVPTEDLLSSGSTLLNLACSDRVNGTFCKGRYFFFVGDSSSGKTFLALTCFAEACRNPHFDKYRLIYDNSEDGALMDMERFFGSKMVSRLEPPRVEDGKPVYSRLAEEFYFNLYDALTNKRPCIYILDSMDSLDTKYSGKKFTEAKAAHEKGKVAKGDYGDGKAKLNSQHIRKVGALLRDTGSILIVICQTRDAIDAGMFEPQQTYAGGRAIKFYAGLEIWTSVGSRLKKTVNGKERQVGIIARCKVKKNRITGHEMTVEVPLYWSTGIDDVGSIVDFLVDEGHWKKNKGGIIKADEIEACLPREELIQHVEANNLERDLQMTASAVYLGILQKCQMERKKRYE